MCIIVYCKIYFTETWWEPPEAHWSCGHSVPARRHIAVNESAGCVTLCSSDLGELCLDCRDHQTCTANSAVHSSALHQHTSMGTIKAALHISKEFGCCIVWH